MSPYPGRHIPLDSENAFSGEFPLILQKVHGRLEPHHFVESTVLPSHVDHETKQDYANAEAIITGQVHRQESAQTFSEGPQHTHRTFTVGLPRWCRGCKRRVSGHGRLCKRCGWHRNIRSTSLVRTGPELLCCCNRVAIATEEFPLWCCRNHRGTADRLRNSVAEITAHRLMILSLRPCQFRKATRALNGYSVFHLRVKLI